MLLLYTNENNLLSLKYLLLYLKAVLEYSDVTKEIFHGVFLHIKTKVFAHVLKQTTHLLVHVIHDLKLSLGIVYKTVALSRK